MNLFFKKFKMMWQDRNLRKRMIFVIAMLVIIRLLSAIPIPGVDTARLSQFLANNQFLGVLNVFSGGGLATLSIIMLGVGPYITASIIMQLSTIMSPRLKALYQENGDAGRLKFAQYSRMITVPLAAIQAFSLLIILKRQGIIADLTPFAYAVNLAVVIAGSMFLMWIGELISEFGIGNGVSLIIFAGIVSALPSHVSQAIFAYDASQIPTILAFTIVGLIVIAGVIFVSEAERLIPVTYTRQVRGSRVIGGTNTYIPIRLNQAGVIPIIFALSILLFPQLIANLFINSSHTYLVAIAHVMSAFIANTWLYSLVYFILVVVFTFFYTAITFDPEQMATNLQKSGAFIPGIRPGAPTSAYVSHILTRLTLFGSVFLGLIAVLPLIVRSITGITSLALGGTALLIVVSVVIDFVKRIDAQLTMKEY